eukprot:2325618-Amphidinium_carterae.1
MLPASGLRKVTYFHISRNYFAGALPDRSMWAIAGLHTFKMASIENNFFAGTVAENLPRSSSRATL